MTVSCFFMSLLLCYSLTASHVSGSAAQYPTTTMEEDRDPCPVSLLVSGSQYSDGNSIPTILTGAGDRDIFSGTFKLEITIDFWDAEFAQPPQLRNRSR